MANTITATQNITQKEIWEQIVKLQTEITDLRNTVNNIGCSKECLLPVTDEGTIVEDGSTVFYDREVALAKIQTICEIFRTREATLNSLLDFYKSMYNDTLNEKKRQAEIVKSMFDNVVAHMANAEIDSEDKKEIVREITSAIKEMTEKVIG